MKTLTIEKTIEQEFEEVKEIVLLKSALSQFSQAPASIESQGMRP